MHTGKKLFYGWWVVIAITIMFFTAGATPFAIVLKQLMAQFHTGRGEVFFMPINIHDRRLHIRNICRQDVAAP